MKTGINTGSKIHLAKTKIRTACGERYNSLDSVYSKDEFIEKLEVGSFYLGKMHPPLDKKYFCKKCLNSIGK